MSRRIYLRNYSVLIRQTGYFLLGLMSAVRQCSLQGAEVRNQVPLVDPLDSFERIVHKSGRQDIQDLLPGACNRRHYACARRLSSRYGRKLRHRIDPVYSGRSGRSGLAPCFLEHLGSCTQIISHWTASILKIASRATLRWWSGSSCGGWHTFAIPQSSSIPDKTVKPASINSREA